MDFSDHLANMDAAIDDRLRDAATLRPVRGGPDLPIRAALERPVSAERFDGADFIRTRPWVEISLRLVPVLVKGDIVLMGAAAPWQGWRIAEAPSRPGDGRHWLAEVEPLGVVAT